MDEGKLCT
uniref:Uncharacterized protein n=1 Tax=Arundo donax TaxID=35708 RepID=A0A0A9B0N7_ARUDO